MLPLQCEPVAVLLLRESDNSPRRAPTDLTDTLNPVIPVLKDQLATAVSNDYWGWLPACLSEFVHRLNAFVPILLVDRAQDRVTRWASEAMQLVEG